MSIARWVRFEQWKNRGAPAPGRIGPEHNAADELPLRAELYSAERMQRHGERLASAHRVRAGPAPDRLLPRLRDNERVLVEARDLLAGAVRARRGITPAGEWLLDNFHLVAEQILLARRHLPKGYSRQLPKLSDGPSAGLPRVYDCALEIGRAHV